MSALLGRLGPQVLKIGKDIYTLLHLLSLTVCEDGSVGVLSIISEPLTVIPDDLKSISQIFSRLFYNWLSKAKKQVCI